MAAATQSVHIQELDPRRQCSTSCHFQDALRQKIVGQDEAVKSIGAVKV